MLAEKARVLDLIRLMTEPTERFSEDELRAYRRTSPGWRASLCPAWCNMKHLTDAI